ncbi:MAG TPA: hypothetical protein ACFYED_07085 [Candidatus Tripitaka californicus]|uniref:hypothetical protein n=1 Tax=Candidatus Tripitaka californicus TaxID=3367616 RepID=UPI004028A859
MSNVVAIGHRDDILPFGVWGLRLLPIASAHELIPALDRAVQACPERSEGTTPSLIIVSEAVVVAGVLSPYMARSHIPILVLPTHRGSCGTGISETAALIKTAIGIDILEGITGGL